MGHRPPKDVQEAAQRAERWIEEGKAGKGFTDTGRHRAHQLANGDEVSDADVKKMQAYFARHEVDKKGRNYGNEDNPSAGYIAWLLWGGDEGRAWALDMKKKVGNAPDI